MAKWSVLLLLLASGFGLLGFTGFAGEAEGLTRILFVVFFGGFLATLFLGKREPAATP